MSSILRALWLTARPKTLSASVVPILASSALVYALGYRVTIGISVFALLSAMMIQIGTNFVNDALDFVKGADSDTRLGEARATQQGWFTARGVMGIGLACFAIAVLFGLPLVIQGGWPIFAIGLFSLFFGYTYTGGPFPLAYLGLGDFFVVIFFGVVAVGGVFYLQTQSFALAAVVAGLQIGLLATVLIAVNNLRDLDQDKLVGKKTLAVRLGPKLGRFEVLFLVAVAYVLGIYWWSLGFRFACALPLLSLPIAIPLVRTVLRTKAGREYNQLLARAALLHIIFGLLLSVGFFLK